MKSDELDLLEASVDLERRNKGVEECLQKKNTHGTHSTNIFQGQKAKLSDHRKKKCGKTRVMV